MVKRVNPKVVRKEGTYHLYRCNVCLRAKFGDNPSVDQVKSASFTNVRKHHVSMHPNVEFVPVRGDAYYQPANAEPKMPKCFQEPMQFKLWIKPEPERPEQPELPVDELDEETIDQLERWFSEPESLFNEHLPSKVWPYEPHQLPFPPAPFYVEPNPEPI